MRPQQYNKISTTSKFTILLFQSTLSILARNIRDTNLRDKKISIFRHGTQKEIQLTSAVEYYFEINTYFVELIMLPKRYLNVDRKKIKLLYGNSVDYRDYYVYQSDNIIIRILTALDLCGKLGNIIYNLGIQEDKCNWYQFTVHKKMKGTHPAKNLESFAKKMKRIKTYRHQKVHKSKTDEKNPFDGIINWESINKLIGGTIDTQEMNTLEMYTDAEIKKRVRELNSLISKTINLTFQFFDTLVPQVQELAKEG